MFKLLMYKVLLSIVRSIPVAIVLALLGYFLYALFIGGTDLGTFSELANGVFHLND